MSNYKLYKDIKVLSATEQNELITKAQGGCKRSRSKLLKHNLKFIIAMAWKYKAVINPNELVGEGVLGLNLAIDKFDITLGNKFMTFAAWLIRKEMSCFLRDKKSLIRIPSSKQADMAKEKKEKSKTSENMSDLFQQLNNLKSSGIRLDKPIKGEGVSIFQDLIADPDKSTTPGSFNDEKIREFTSNLLAELPEIEHKILSGYWGIGRERLNLKELSVLTNLSPERVRQLKEQGLNRIRKLDNNKDLLNNYLEAFAN